MNPIVLQDGTINHVWSRRREAVDRFRISVSRKPCVVERNGGYFQTRGTRQICLRGIFVQEDPWSPDDRFGVVRGGRLMNALIPNWKSRIFGWTNFRSDLWCFYTSVSRTYVNVLYTSLVCVQASVGGEGGGVSKTYAPRHMAMFFMGCGCNAVCTCNKITFVG